MDVGSMDMSHSNHHHHMGGDGPHDMAAMSHGGGHMQMDHGMAMTFHDSHTTDLLFRGLSTNDIGYAAQITLCFFAGLLAVVFKVLRNRMELHLAAATEMNGRKGYARFLFLSACNACRATAVFLILSWDYFLMLAVMTFNVGVFCAIVAGVATGFLFFGHLFTTLPPMYAYPQRVDVACSPQSEATQPTVDRTAKGRQCLNVEQLDCCGSICP